MCIAENERDPRRYSGRLTELLYAEVACSSSAANGKWAEQRRCASLIIPNTLKVQRNNAEPSVGVL